MGNSPQAQVEGVVATSIKAAEEATSATIPPEVMEKCMATAEVGIGVRRVWRWRWSHPPRNHDFFKIIFPNDMTNFICFGDFFNLAL